MSAAKLHQDVPADWYHRSIKENIIQRFVHNQRFKEVGKLIEPTGGKILDIGCADGVFTEIICRQSKADKVIGIDVRQSSLNWAKKHWKKYSRIKFQKGDAHNLKFKNGTFDAVFAIEILEHVFEPRKVLSEVKRVMKKGGYAIFLVPTESLLFRLVWFFWTKYRGKIWKDTHVHAYSGNYLVKLVRDMGFKIVEDKKIIFRTLHLVKARRV